MAREACNSISDLSTLRDVAWSPREWKISNTGPKTSAIAPKMQQRTRGNSFKTETVRLWNALKNLLK